MNFQFYIEKLKNSESFKKFIAENKDAFPCSGFFVIEFSKSDHPDNKQHFDYFVPSKKKMFSFKLEEDCRIVPIEIIGNTELIPISLNHEFNFDDIANLIAKRMKKDSITNEVQKILISMQNKDKKDYLVGTVFISNFGLIKVNIDLNKMKITDFEKKSFFDMLKIVKKGEDKK